MRYVVLAAGVLLGCGKPAPPPPAAPPAAKLPPEVEFDPATAAKHRPAAKSPTRP